MHYRSIDIALHSQLNIEALPEHHPIPRDDHTAPDTTSFMPELFDSRTSTCSVFVPVMPGGTFWIKYRVRPPIPEEQYFLFKLYIDGAHIVNWSTGKAEGWKGKTMFGLFESPEDMRGKRRIEKRMFYFVPPDGKKKHWGCDTDTFDEKACVEIRVHRAGARKRVQREVEEYVATPHAKKNTGITLVNAGQAGREQPKRFYKFALIDPVDQPFATFRYFYRTRDQLRDLGVLRPSPNSVEEENDLPVIEPHDGSTSSLVAERDRCTSVNIKLQNGSKNYKRDSTGSKKSITVSKRERSRATFRPIRRISAKPRRLCLMKGLKGQARAHVPHNAPKVKTEMLGGQFIEMFDEQASQEDSFVCIPPKSHRLSIPPSIKLEPTEMTVRPLPSPPRKESPQSPTAYSPHPVDPMNNWIACTPSPIKAFREEFDTPSPGKRAGRCRTAFSLMGMISSVWKHRSLRTPDRAASAESFVAAPSLQR